MALYVLFVFPNGVHQHSNDLDPNRGKAGKTCKSHHPIYIYIFCGQDNPTTYVTEVCSILWIYPGYSMGLRKMDRMQIAMGGHLDAGLPPGKVS